MRIRTVPLDRPPPILDHRPELAWISEDQVLTGHGEVLRVAAGVGAARFASAADALSAFEAQCDIDDPLGLPGSGLVAFSSFTFDARSHGSVLIVPRIAIGRHRDRWFITTVDDADATHLLEPVDEVSGEPDRPRFAGASIPDIHWLEAVAEVIDRIKSGDADKVVMARDFALWSRTPFDSRRLLGRLADRFPACFTFAVDGLIGASPELLLRTDGTRIESLALAGTIGRSADAHEDDRLGRSLLASTKDRVEHRIAASSVADVLGRLASDLTHDEQPFLRKLDNLQHLATAFAGTLDRPVTALEIIAELHPTAAVGGHPTTVAVEMIRELEGMDRGRYAGPVGWVDASGNAEFAIALRCAEISGARARLFAGAGIMSDSLPERELEETRLKLGAMMTALE